MKRRIFFVMLAALAAGCSNGGAGGDSSVGVSNAEHLGETSFSSPEKFVERWNQQTNDPLVAIKNGHNIDSHFNASGPNQPIGLLHSDQINLNVGDEDLTHVYVIYIKSQKKYSYVALTKGEGNLDGSVICRNMIVAAGLSEQEANIIFGRASDMLESNKSLGSAKYKGISVSLAYTPTPICSVSEINSEVASAPNGGGEGIGPETTIDREKLKRDAVTYIAVSHNMSPDDVVSYSADVTQKSSTEYSLAGSFVVESDAPTNIYEAASAHVNSQICSIDPNQCASTKFKHTVNFNAIATIYKKLDGTDGIKWSAKVGVDTPLVTPVVTSSGDGLTDRDRTVGWKRVLLTSGVTITDAFEKMNLGPADLQQVVSALGRDAEKLREIANSPVDFLIKDSKLIGFRFEIGPGRITVFMHGDKFSKLLQNKMADGGFDGGTFLEIAPSPNPEMFHREPVTASSASFDCTKATNPTERAICSDDGLAELDGKMGAAYKRNLKEQGDSKSLLAAQRSWIQERNRECGGDKSCIETKLQLRIQDLNEKPTEDHKLSRDLQWAYRIDARYPPQAIRERHEGTAVVLVLVGTDGLPKDIQIKTSSGYRELDRAAIEAAQRWRFNPAIKNGEAVESFISAPVGFSLNHVSGSNSA